MKKLSGYIFQYMFSNFMPRSKFIWLTLISDLTQSERVEEKVRLLKQTAVHHEREERLTEGVNQGQSFIYSSKCSLLVPPCSFVSVSKKTESAAVLAAPRTSTSRHSGVFR